MENNDTASLATQSSSSITHTDFESNIINAYKETSSFHKCNLFIKTALDSLQAHITYCISNDIFIIKSPNILERLKRITQRKNILITINIAKIYLGIIMKYEYYDKLTNDIVVLINLSNEIINIIDIIYSLPFSFLLKQKVSLLLNYINSIDEKNKIFTNKISEEQKFSLSSLITSLPSSFYSESYLSMNTANNDTYAKIEQLKKIFSASRSLSEQYAMLSKFPLMYEYPLTPSMMYQYGMFFYNLLFAFNYIIDTSINTESNDTLTLLIDATRKPMSYTQSISYNNISYDFINGKKFSLYNSLKGIQLTYANNNNEIVVVILNYIKKANEKYSSDINIMSIVFMILKRIWINYIHYSYVKKSADYKAKIIDILQKKIIDTYINIVKIQNDKIEDDIKSFIVYLVKNNYLKELKEQLFKIGSKLPSSEISVDDNITNEVIHFSNLNIPLGYPNVVDIEAGSSNTVYINVTQTNTLIYITFSVDVSDITFRLFKFFYDKGVNEWKEMYSIEKSPCENKAMKVVLFAKKEGVYKVVFDNEYSWIRAKRLTYRVVLMKAIEQIEIEGSDDYDVDSSIMATGNEEQNAKTLEVFSKKKKLFVFYENIHHTFDVDEIDKDISMMTSKIKEEISNEDIIDTSSVNRNIDIQAMKKDNNTINLFIQGVNIYLISYSSNELTYKVTTDKDSLSSSPSNEFPILSRVFLERYLDSLVTSLKSYNLKVININIYSMNQNNIVDLNSTANTTLETFSTETLNYVPSMAIVSSVRKLGVYPISFISMNPNVNVNVKNFCDEALIYHMIKRVSKGESFDNTICSIHFDSNVAQISMFNEGGLFNSIRGFNYDSSINLISNFENIKEFISKASDSFDGLDLVLSYTNIKQNEIDMFNREMRVLASSKKEHNIRLYIYDSNFVYEVVRYHNIIYDKKNYSIFNNENNN